MWNGSPYDRRRPGQPKPAKPDPDNTGLVEHWVKASTRERAKLIVWISKTMRGAIRIELDDRPCVPAGKPDLGSKNPGEAIPDFPLPPAPRPVPIFTAPPEPVIPMPRLGSPKLMPAAVTESAPDMTISEAEIDRLAKLFGNRDGQ